MNSTKKIETDHTIKKQLYWDPTIFKRIQNKIKQNKNSNSKQSLYWNIDFINNLDNHLKNK